MFDFLHFIVALIGLNTAETCISHSWCRLEHLARAYFN